MLFTMMHRGLSVHPPLITQPEMQLRQEVLLLHVEHSGRQLTQVWFGVATRRKEELVQLLQ